MYSIPVPLEPTIDGSNKHIYMCSTIRHQELLYTWVKHPPARSKTSLEMSDIKLPISFFHTLQSTY